MNPSQGHMTQKMALLYMDQLSCQCPKAGSTWFIEVWLKASLPCAWEPPSRSTNPSQGCMMRKMALFYMDQLPCQRPKAGSTWFIEVGLKVPLPCAGEPPRVPGKEGPCSLIAEKRATIHKGPVPQQSSNRKQSILVHACPCLLLKI